jgi:hypothetical protein
VANSDIICQEYFASPFGNSIMFVIDLTHDFVNLANLKSRYVPTDIEHIGNFKNDVILANTLFLYHLHSNLSLILNASLNSTKHPQPPNRSQLGLNHSMYKLITTFVQSIISCAKKLVVLTTLVILPFITFTYIDSWED